MSHAWLVFSVICNRKHLYVYHTCQSQHPSRQLFSSPGNFSWLLNALLSFHLSFSSSESKLLIFSFLSLTLPLSHLIISHTPLLTYTHTHTLTLVIHLCRFTSLSTVSLVIAWTLAQCNIPYMFHWIVTVSVSDSSSRLLAPDNLTVPWLLPLCFTCVHWPIKMRLSRKRGEKKGIHSSLFTNACVSLITCLHAFAWERVTQVPFTWNVYFHTFQILHFRILLWKGDWLGRDT